MAAKGTESKNIIFKKLQEVFPESFWEDENKILRVPLNENGSRIEIKVTLTAAKNNLGGEAPASAFESSNVFEPTAMNKPTEEKIVAEPTDEEKENVAKLIASLGL